TITTLPRSRSSKGSSRVGAAPACTSAGAAVAPAPHPPSRRHSHPHTRGAPGHASRIEVTLEPGNRLSVADNGRGIPVDPHPKFPGKSALEVILTTLHSGGKFEGKAYSTSGGLHGGGVSVVNALSTETIVEVARDKKLYRQAFAKGVATSPLEEVGAAPNKRGTTVTFTPDPEIFGADARFDPARLLRLVRSKAYLFAGVEIRWRCDPSLASAEVPEQATFQFPGGLADHLAEQLRDRPPLPHPPLNAQP